MRFTSILLGLLLALSDSSARTLEIGQGKEFADLSQAASAARPGDTITFTTGVHAGGAHITELHGTDGEWITIRGDGAKGSIIRGGSFAFQLSDIAFVRIEGLVFEGQTGNGVNIDDGGTYETPTSNIRIDGCEWRSINASGNNDLLKLSGVDEFRVTNCTFRNGAEGGSMIDMVGCHVGAFEGNLFEEAGSNCIQAKGGSSYIFIERNVFLNGGQRAINIGGSTGLEFFRPLGATYEAKSIHVCSNIFEGGVASVAFVGAIDCSVTNNTMIRPERWAIRILQESVEGFQACGNNSFINNIVVFNSTQPAINIGSNTAPETFTFSHNLWFNPDNASWSGPNTPVPEAGRILNQDPQFADAGYRLAASSPAKAAGLKVAYPTYDRYDLPFDDPRSIGAVEFTQASVTVEEDKLFVRIYPNPVSSLLHLSMEADRPSLHIEMTDVLGKLVWSGSGADQYVIDVSQWMSGFYQIRLGTRVYSFLKK